MRSSRIRIILLMILFYPLLSYSQEEPEIFYPLIKLNQLKKPESTQKISNINLQNFKLRAIVTSGENELALINDKYLREGEQIENCKLEKILPSPPSVVLDCRGIKVKLQLNLTDEISEEDQK